VTDFHPQKIFEVLDEHEIDFVVIGAMAAVLQGAALTATFDVDIAAATTDENRTRLASALRAMDARLRLGPGEEPVQIPVDARLLSRVSVMTFVTEHGPFDVLFEPAGAPEYETLRDRAQLVTRSGITFRAAAIEDVIEMKRAAGREKDAEHVALLLDYLEGRAG
jgi:hypothetical protein